MTTTGSSFCMLLVLLDMWIMNISGAPITTSSPLSSITSSTDDATPHMAIDDDIPLPVTSTDPIRHLQEHVTTVPSVATATHPPVQITDSSEQNDTSFKYNNITSDSAGEDRTRYDMLNNSTNITADTEDDPVTDGSELPSGIMRHHLHMHMAKSYNPGDGVAGHPHHSGRRNYVAHQLNSSHIKDTDHQKAQKQERKNQTEFYAWIFGGTMLTLATVSTAVSCIVFCFCGGEKWRHPKRLRVDDAGEYHRVENVYPPQEREEPEEREEGSHPTDTVTVI